MLKGIQNLFKLHDFSNFRSSDYFSQSLKKNKQGMFLHNVDRALTRKLQLGPSGPNWECECSKDVRVSAPKWSWGVWGCSEPPPQGGGGVLGDRAP